MEEAVATKEEARLEGHRTNSRRDVLKLVCVVLDQ